MKKKVLALIMAGTMEYLSVLRFLRCRRGGGGGWGGFGGVAEEKKKKEV